MVINNIEFARKALEIHDIIAISQLSRLREALASGSGVLNYSLAGGVGADGKPELRLVVQGELQLRCQRCLEPVPFALDVHIQYGLVADESEVPLEDDDRDYLTADAQMNVMDLIEDEVLLALPMAPMHPEENCAASGTLNQLEKPSPFAVLRSLKTGVEDN